MTMRCKLNFRLGAIICQKVINLTPSIYIVRFSDLNFLFQTVLN